MAQLAAPTIRNRSNLFHLFLPLFLVLAQVEAADYDVGPIRIAQPWARATPKGAKSGAGYMTITNNGSTPDRLSCVSNDASAKCQIHTMTTENELPIVDQSRPAWPPQGCASVCKQWSSSHRSLLNA
jgi:hypothetical protein